MACNAKSFTLNNDRMAPRKNLNVRVTEDELAMLKALADAHGLSASDIVRQCIRREHEKIASPPKRKPAKKRSKRAAK